ncbi:CBS domain-containing protein [Vreelandella populi]|uniref:CBS domain-containing protein n=1 Tax=Vreelandella populi TaxID=2498858 RepID=A0A3S0YKZ8_9GAMM|nr:CBS domain-containing protein [Halomonas populi]RUR35747.1 CBS domain-containing protein [Halomonas populi]RUR47938.1 CBS domain-containing protein [Halomonas populi]
MNQVAFSPKSLIQFNTTPRLTSPEAKRLTTESSALDVLTDFQTLKPHSVTADTPVDEAHLKMRHSGVRLLFVTDKQSHCLGILTSRELIGTRRINLAMQQRNLDRNEITAEMIMTPWNKLSAMTFAQLSALTIEDLVFIMEDATEQHLLITQYDAQHELTIRGLVSATDIQNAVGKEVNNVVPMARSFADICQVITGHDL